MLVEKALASPLSQEPVADNDQRSFTCNRTSLMFQLREDTFGII